MVQAQSQFSYRVASKFLRGILLPASAVVPKQLVLQVMVSAEIAGYVTFNLLFNWYFEFCHARGVTFVGRLGLAVWSI